MPAAINQTQLQELLQSKTVHLGIITGCVLKANSVLSIPTGDYNGTITSKRYALAKRIINASIDDSELWTSIANQLVLTTTELDFFNYAKTSDEVASAFTDELFNIVAKVTADDNN